MTTAYLDVTAANGVPFRVVYIPGGESNVFRGYTWPEAGVEFYDLRFTDRFGPYGQFVSSYFTETLTGDARPNTGLDLDGGIPDWKVDTDTYRRILAWLETQDCLCRYPA